MKILAVSLALLLVGCAVQPVAIKSGTRPTEDQADRLVRDYLARTLKDPDSLKQFRITGMQTVGWAQATARHEEAWLICFEYNAKNSYGGYVGVKPGGLVVRQWSDSPGMSFDILSWSAAKSYICQ